MKKQTGFTLIEILIVIAILGALIALVAPNIVNKQGQANITIAKTQMSNIKNALNIYKTDNFTFPSSDQGLQALVEKPSGSPEPRNWNGPYMEKLPEDPWGNEFVYFKEGSSFELISYGADGTEGGEEDGSDISSKDL